MRTRTKVLIGVGFGALVLVAIGAPFLLMLVPNPVPTRVTEMSPLVAGAYIDTGGALYRVFPRAEQPDTFPADSLTTDAQPTVWVQYRQLDRLDYYGLYTLSGAAVAVEHDTTRPNLLGITPVSPLRPGRYYAELARDGLYGGTDYLYFVVAAPGE
jgi:hypothetical protein